MPIGNVPQQPLTSEVRTSSDRMQDGAEAAADAFNERRQRDEDIRQGVDESNRRKKEETSKQK